MAQAKEHKIKEYLLGQLTAADEEQVELLLLTDPDFAEEYDTVVNEITDDYVAGRFAAEDLKQVEQSFFKSSERQNKLRFAQALNSYPKTKNQSVRQSSSFARNRQTWIFRVAAGIAALVVVTGAFWFLRVPSSTTRTFANLTLNVSDSVRAEGSQPALVKLPLNADALKISLRLPNSNLIESPARYRVELQNDNGEKKTLNVSAFDAHSVTVEIPAAEFRPGQYLLKVFAVRPDGAEQRVPGNYLFTAE
ncbi:MAG: hypothetical protein QOG23_4067 [Blastocatellia bacterium]|jgi:hypothetical protein|nr:hypothetical protein [Blastocatellia bacterium]